MFREPECEPKKSKKVKKKKKKGTKKKKSKNLEVSVSDNEIVSIKYVPPVVTPIYAEKTKESTSHSSECFSEDLDKFAAFR
mmetsp:Transcript_36809/g.45015  ORF Transcript_36809/g.45015 Transcript_36809/m.45015 type:complete len:81 (-) Transcript_36809:302-544(-)